MSKELEALENIKHYDSRVGLHESDYDIIENALKRLDMYEKVVGIEQIQDTNKKLKALEIIKEKKVNVGDFIRCKTLADYNDYLCYNDDEKLTQEEFDLLKEVLL